MTEERIKEIIKAGNFSPEVEGAVMILAREIERETRQEFFSLIQNANNAASSNSITARQLNKFIWDTEQEEQARRRDARRHQ